MSVRHPSLFDVARLLALSPTADDPGERKHHRRPRPVPAPTTCLGCGARAATLYCDACAPSLDRRVDGRELAAHRATSELDGARRGEPFRPAEVF
jgi:hypothetical protein